MALIELLTLYFHYHPSPSNPLRSTPREDTDNEGTGVLIQYKQLWLVISWGISQSFDLEAPSNSVRQLQLRAEFPVIWLNMDEE